MHSSPSLRPRLAAVLFASVALASFGCQDSSEPENEAPQTSEPSKSESTPPTAASENQRPSESAPTTTRVGTPNTMPSEPKGMKPPPDDDASAPNAPDRKQSEPSMPSTPAAPDLSCSADTDCKMFESTCGSCRCLILPVNAEPPMCSGPKVTCVISPCRDKRPVCNAQMCALKDEGPASM